MDILFGAISGLVIFALLTVLLKLNDKYDKDESNQ